jgi:hypothetical protein
VGRTFEQQEDHGHGVAATIINPKTNLNLAVQTDNRSIDLGDGGPRLSLDSLDGSPPDLDPPPDVSLDVTGPSLGQSNLVHSVGLHFKLKRYFFRRVYL